ncbi:Flp pilus assembly pilin Flp [Spinactinospora alkalitolerans]|uniref:Flp pilus assembly pilin Flp n=1 Tax=Spinactinospora alkalitolerans TaxID=687207 RepID=A0A852TUG0_9ACTN|nr:polymorphic toxin-type HINT domain-containing protein [Spinactinospora alkalitolerans]NYE45560.1 Flp pilus assembly pilin Flp [Spinactinospora alkalitolerans]
MLRKIHDPERGASLLEYAAVILLVAAIAAAVIGSGVAQQIATGLGEAVDRALNPDDPANPDVDVADGPRPESGDPGQSGENTPGEPAQSGEPLQPGDDSLGDPADFLSEGFLPAVTGDPQTFQLTYADNDAPAAGGPDIVPVDNPGSDGGGEDDNDENGWWNEDCFWGYGCPSGDMPWFGFQDRGNYNWDCGIFDGVCKLGGGFLKGVNDVGESITSAGCLVHLCSHDDFRDTWSGVGTIFTQSPLTTLGQMWDGFTEPFEEASEQGGLWGNIGYSLPAAIGGILKPFKLLKGLGDDDGPDSGNGNGNGNGSDSDGEDEDDPPPEEERDENRPGACDPNSFVPGTLVLMADGGYLPIQEVAVGNEVWAGDPETGESGPREVTDLITGDGEKEIVEVTVTAEDGSTDTVTATDGHPFWAPQYGAWIEAGELQPGTWLQTGAGSWAQVSAVATWTAPDQQVHNLTVADLHTYHVSVGSADVLVHNDGEECGDLGEDWEPRDPSEICNSSGCEDVAAEIQSEIGGEVRVIRDGYGAPGLGQYRGEDTMWSEHWVVVKDGRVYDAWTGRYGEPIDDYLENWQYGEDLQFTDPPD